MILIQNENFILKSFFTKLIKFALILSNNVLLFNMDKRRNTYDRVRKKEGYIKEYGQGNMILTGENKAKKYFSRISPIKISVHSEILPQIPSRKLSTI